MTKFRHFLLPGKCPPNYEFLNLHNKAYLFWRDFWINVFKQNGAASVVRSDDLVRQDYIGVIEANGTIAGLYGASILLFDQLSLIEHSYFSGSFNKEYLGEIRKRQIKAALTIEYLTVDTNWRKRVLGFSLAEVLIGLHTRLFKLLGLDVIVAVAREDVGVPKMAYKWGYFTVQSGVLKHNTPCQLIACYSDEVKCHSDEMIQKNVELLWERRIDTLTGRNGPLSNVA